MISAFTAGPQCPPARDGSNQHPVQAACWECKARFLGILGLGIVLGDGGSLKGPKEAGKDPEKLKTETQSICVALVMTVPSSHILA